MDFHSLSQGYLKDIVESRESPRGTKLSRQSSIQTNVGPARQACWQSHLPIADDLTSGMGTINWVSGPEWVRIFGKISSLSRQAKSKIASTG